MKETRYSDAGVDISAANEAKKRIISAVKTTHGPQVLGGIGGFGGLFSTEDFPPNPVLVSSIDGVGTKLKIAFILNRHNTVGEDIVNHCVNDILVQGARPLFFMDYLATGKLEPGIVEKVVEGIASACRLNSCALLGGETAEMPGFYTEGEYDLAGTIVGVVNRDSILTGEAIANGDVILGLASSGLHSNGYTLARDICFKRGQLAMIDTPQGLNGAQLGDVLLEPTRIYVKPVVQVLAEHKENQVVHAMAHITGGGLVGNVPRVLPDQCDALIEPSTWPVPDIFPFLQEKGPVQTEEMYRVFNMGIGFVLVVDAKSADSVVESLSTHGENVYTIGQITEGTGQVKLT